MGIHKKTTAVIKHKLILLHSSTCYPMITCISLDIFHREDKNNNSVELEVSQILRFTVSGGKTSKVYFERLIARPATHY